MGAGAGVAEPGCWWEHHGGPHAGPGRPLGAAALSRPCSMAHARWPVSRGTPTPQLPLPSQFLICDKKPALLLVSQFLICDKKLAKNAGCSFYKPVSKSKTRKCTVQLQRVAVIMLNLHSEVAFDAYDHRAEPFGQPRRASDLTLTLPRRR